jgi:DNA invertase Pin-like site-specific DNA recombinase
VLLKDLRLRDIEFKSLHDGFDTRTAIGRFVMTLMGAFAELEKEVIQERVRDGLRQARLNGKILGRPVKGEGEEVSRATEYRRKAKAKL